MILNKTVLTLNEDYESPKMKNCLNKLPYNIIYNEVLKSNLKQ
jgi:hypothetical protein